MIRYARHLPKVFVYTLLAVALALGAAVLGLRYWLLPNIERYRDDIAAGFSQTAGTRVAIGAVHANWDGLRPHLELDRVQVFDRLNNPALELVKVEATLSWRSLLARTIRLHSLEIVQPSLEIRRDKAGKLFVAGMEVGEKREGGGLSDLVLETRSVFIDRAVLSWEDEFRGAPLLVLDGVSFHLENRGLRHRFGLTATPPAQMAGAMDLRGDLSGRRFSDLKSWSGKLYGELPYVDGGAWRSYLPLPRTFSGGRGAIRAWLDFKGEKVESLVADLKLSDTVAQLDESLPQLHLASLAGRIRYRSIGDGFEVASEKLSLVTSGDTRVGSTDFLLRSEPKQKSREAQGEFRVNQIELAAWASLMEYLPLDKTFKARVAEFAPGGRLSDFAFKWTGQPDTPSKYSLSGRIERGAVRPVDRYPGAVGLSASIEASEDGGSLTVQSASQFLLPRVFASPLPVDTLSIKAKWRRKDGNTDITLSEVNFANADLAGSASGSFRTIPGQRGVIDLNARLTRVDGRHTGLYVPLVVGPHTRAWLERAVIAAKSQDATLRLSGDLKDFPFPDGKKGQFLVTAKLTDGVLDYAEGWPRVENIRGELSFHGYGMAVKANEGTIFATKLKNVAATIANLNANEPVLEINGEASGPVAEKLRFINQSPVKNMIGGFTEGLTAGGNGKLALKLSIPVNNTRATKVNGDYQFQNGSLEIGPDSLPITEINGRLQFSETGLRAQGIVARILGGPANINVASVPEGGVRIDAAGTATVAAINALVANPLLKRVSGSADWQGHMSLRKGSTEITLTSPLTGVVSDLPAPLRKTAGQDMPLTLERQLNAGRPELIRAKLAESIFAEFERVDPPGPEGPYMKRGVVSFGKPATLPAQDGLWVSGSLRTLDIDRWREVLKTQGSGAASALAGIDLTLGSIDAFDRAFTDLRVIGRAEGGNWQGTVAGRELTGDFTWRPAGKGLLHARLQRLIIPQEKPGSAAPAEASTAEGDFPALDIMADDLQIKSKKLGRLELKAEQQGKDWRIERLQLTQAEATLQADGLWSRGTKAQTALKLHLTAPDAGKLLDELGFARSVRRGRADLSGDLSWPGAPYEMLPAKLSGNLKLEVKSGQFLKAQPGAGRLLGLISLQALPRRITLDFRDIFSEGFSFDEIRGDVHIQQGLLNTKDFTISGPSAKVEMTGDVNLAQETQQLTVKVIPTVGEGVSIASGLLGGPAVGVTALILQKVFKDPLNRAAAYEYNVTGTWDNPNVVKVERKAIADDTRQQ